MFATNTHIYKSKIVSIFRNNNKSGNNINNSNINNIYNNNININN